MLTCGVCAPVCCTRCVYVCVSMLHLVCEFTAEWRHTAACYSKGRGPQGKSTPTSQDLEGFADKSAFLLGLHRHQQAEERSRDFGRKKKVLGKRQGGGIMQGTCHAHQCADMRGEYEVGTCQVSTWREVPKTGRRGSLCFQQSLTLHLQGP